MYLFQISFGENQESLRGQDEPLTCLHGSPNINRLDIVAAVIASVSPSNSCQGGSRWKPCSCANDPRTIMSRCHKCWFSQEQECICV